MKTKLTMLLVFLAAGLISFAGNPKDNGSPFQTIYDFETAVNTFRDPGGSGQTTGVIFQNDELEYITYRLHETVIVNPVTGSTGSMKLNITWNTDVEWMEPTYGGTASNYVRLWSEPQFANVEGKRFYPGEAIEVFLHGDGKGNRFRFMVRDALFNLEGSEWITVDWTGWKRLTWDYNDAANVFGWVNGNGVMDLNAEGGGHFYFDSFHVTRDVDGTTTDALFYFDDLRIVKDKFDVDFNIAGADGNEIISIAGEVFDAGVTKFAYFPGEYEYFVKKDGFLTTHGFFEVDDQAVTVNVTPVTGVDPTYTVTFTVIGAEEEILNDASVTIGTQTINASPYEFQLTPGFYDYTVNRELYFNSTGSFTLLDGNRFINVVMEEIPDVVDRIFLSWDVAPSASTPNFRRETYSVWVAKVTPGQAFDSADYEKVFEETLSSEHPQWVYKNRKLDISTFQQENIRVAFRHNNSTDKDRLVLDNVKVVGVAEGEADMVLIDENFNGGIPAGFDPETFDPADPNFNDTWLPAGWLAVDADNDGFNWYFAIDVDQSMNYAAHMRSQSYDSAENKPLTPDNWLVTPSFQMPWAFFHTVTFTVKDDAGVALTGAKITIDGIEYPVGQYAFSLPNGTFDYAVTLADYYVATGTFIVAGEAKDVDVELTLIPLFKVEFNVNMNQAPGFVVGETEVYFTGSFFEWAVPGSDDKTKLEHTDNVYIRTKTLHLPAGTYQYKYYNGPSFDNGEWQGGNDRVIVVVADDIVRNDVFGVFVSVNEFTAATVSMHPNPARQQVSITADSRISEVTIYTLAGQQVYSRQVNDTEHTLRLDGFNNGIYMVRILTAEGVQTRKLQVVK